MPALKKSASPDPLKVVGGVILFIIFSLIGLSIGLLAIALPFLSEGYPQDFADWARIGMAIFFSLLFLSAAGLFLRHGLR